MKTKLSCITVILSGLLSTFASAALPQEFDHSADLSLMGVAPKSIEEMDSLLQSYIDDQKVSSIVGFMAKDGHVIYDKAFGWSDIEKKKHASVDDYYVLFSQTKAITTVAFMTLVEKGLVGIHDPVEDYFPEIPHEVVTKVNEDGTYQTRPIRNKMTFVHLMSHTSGLGAGMVHQIHMAKNKKGDAPVGFGGEGSGKIPAGQHSGGGNPDARYLEEEMMDLVQYPLGFDPGTHWEYHISSNMLGYLVERISGQPLREYVKENILEPLGMNDTDWYYAPEAIDRFVKPYTYADGKLERGTDVYSQGTISEQQTYAEGAIGLNGPIEDYAKFCQMLLNGGEFNGHRILRPETIELMTKINRLPENSGADTDFKFGLGFELHSGIKPIPEISDSAFSWGGMLGTQYLIDPENNTVSLFYINMFQREDMYVPFLDHAYSIYNNTASATGKVVLENGGTGPYSAIVTEDPSLPGMTIYRPEDLSAFGTDQKLPILLWADGGCVNTTKEHRLFLNEVASHGYLIIALGLFDHLDHHDDISLLKTHSSQLIEGLDWITKESKTSSSIFFNKVDIAKVAAMGMSCGGLQAIEISGDPRICTTVVCNSGVLKEPTNMFGMPALTKDALLDYHAPVLYLMGGPTDIAYGNAMDDFSRIQHVPVVMTNLDVGHEGTYAKPHGGAYSPVAIAWLDWQLKGDTLASRVFLGEDSALAQDSDWTVDYKNFDDQ